jgi:hypothetical protein
VRILCALTIGAFFWGVVAPIPADAGQCARAAALREAQERKAERLKKRKQRAAKREKIDRFMEPIDKNNDNSISEEEFLAENPDGKSKFDQYNKNKDGYLTKSEIEDMLGL